MIDVCEVRIESLTSEGHGIARPADAPVIFVPFTAPGDHARVRVVSKQPRFWRAVLVELIESGPGRTAALCTAFQRCGGCQWQHLEYGVQLDAKRKLLEDALQRIGKMAAPLPISMLPSPCAYDYRARARIVARSGLLGYRLRNSHAFCAVDSCPILLPALRTHWRQFADKGKLADGEWELRWGLRASGQESVQAFPLPITSSEESLGIPVGKDLVTIPPGGFFQSNVHLLTSLANAVCRAAGRGSTLLELYCGSGFFTLELARRFERVIAIESSRTAVQALRHNLEFAKLTNVKTVVGDVGRVLGSRNIGLSNNVEVVVLDPPRTGIDKRALEGMLALGPNRIIYLSCNPATLARDLARLATQGYSLSGVEGVDLFPQTSHVEALAVLSRKQAE